MKQSYLLHVSIILGIVMSLDSTKNRKNPKQGKKGQKVGKKEMSPRKPCISSWSISLNWITNTLTLEFASHFKILHSFFKTRALIDLDQFPLHKSLIFLLQLHLGTSFLSQLQGYLGKTGRKVIWKSSNAKGKLKRILEVNGPK